MSEKISLDSSDTGYEISPKNLHILVERLPVIFPPAPIETITGKTNSMQQASYSPFIQK